MRLPRGDGEKEEEEEEELSEPSSPLKRPSAAPAASMKRPAAATAVATAATDVMLPVYIHTRYTLGAEGQYILDSKKMSVVSCSKKQHRDYKALMAEIKKELESKRFETQEAARARMQQMILAS